MKTIFARATRGRPVRVLFASAISACALLSLALLGGIGFAKSSVSAAQYKKGECTNATLVGAYGIRSHGNLSPSQSPTPIGTNTPRVAIGRLDFDGNGNATGVTYGNPPGTTSPDGNAVGSPVTLQYQVRPDCTGYTQLPNGALAFVLVDIRAGVARQIEIANMTPGVYTTTHGTRISR